MLVLSQYSSLKEAPIGNLLTFPPTTSLRSTEVFKKVTQAGCIFHSSPTRAAPESWNLNFHVWSSFFIIKPNLEVKALVPQSYLISDPVVTDLVA